MSDNGSRAEKAKGRVLDYSGEDLRTDIVDLLSDLRHLCKSEELDFDDIVMMSEIHFEEEEGEA